MAINISLPDDHLTFATDELSDYTQTFQRKPGGIYVLRNGAGYCLYVGKSVNLLNRLRTHVSSSPFASEIDVITVYFVNNEAERDIYETYAINHFNAKYNRAKVSKPLPLRSDIEMIEELQYELADLKVRRADVVYGIRSLDAAYGPPSKKRATNNFTGEMSDAYFAHLDYLEYYRQEIEPGYREERGELTRELSEIDSEIEVTKQKLRKFTEKVRV